MLNHRWQNTLDDRHILVLEVVEHVQRQTTCTRKIINNWRLRSPSDDPTAAITVGDGLPTVAAFCVMDLTRLENYK